MDAQPSAYYCPRLKDITTTVRLYQLLIEYRSSHSTDARDEQAFQERRPF